MSRRHIFLLGALIQAVFLGAACEREMRASFAAPARGILYGSSRRAAAGTLSLFRKETFTYRFDPPLEVSPNQALAIRYQVRPSPEPSPGTPVLYAGDLSWELPLNAAFLGLESPGELSYRIPLRAGSLEGFRLAAVLPRGAEEGTRGTVLALQSVALTGAGYGYGKGSPLELSPFVYQEEGALVIDPPGGFFSGAAEFQAIGEGPFTLETGGLWFEAPGSFSLPPGFPTPPLRLFSEAPASPEVIRLIPVKERLFPEEPIPADPGLILLYSPSAWRNPRYEVFRWESFPSILIFDTADYAVQDCLFKRLAFFTEKKGFRGRLAPDREIADLHGWNAHDYPAESLAAFFEKARGENFPLLPEERELQSILLANGLIRREGEQILPGQGALISISQESPDYLRSRFMAHEGFHGIYFIDQDFRAFSLGRWKALPLDARRFILSFFDFQGYDIKDTPLVINEFMAHVLQQPVSQAGIYFGEILPNMMITQSPWRQSALPQEEISPSGIRQWPSIVRAFTGEAQAFSRYVQERWALEAGRVSRVRAVSMSQ